MIEDTKEEAGLGGGFAYLRWLDSGLRQKAPETLRILRKVGQRLNRNIFCTLLIKFALHGESDHLSFQCVCVSSTAHCYSMWRGKSLHLCTGVVQIRVGEEKTMKKTVLIVEDNDLNMKLFNDLLEAHGYATLKTADGIEAIELARAHKPDLILMDIQLPEVSGLEVTKWIKEDDNLKSIPVIAVTAFAMKGDEERIRQGGCEAYLSKPISVSKFLETVRAYLGPAAKDS
jgi:two-component system, cell cycle response regulator DivK